MCVAAGGVIPSDDVSGLTPGRMKKEAGLHSVNKDIITSNTLSPASNTGHDVRWKNKFWGRTMEIVPVGTIHIVLPCFGDHYELNRVTSCIHNILSGERWIEHYGEMTIKNTATSEDTSICKVTFLKSKSRSMNTNDVEAVVTGPEGRVLHSLFGKWNEALYLGDPPSAVCIWRASM
ncbi:oxysterol-binding protein-related protein 3a [Tachysurus ichikawai]